MKIHLLIAAAVSLSPLICTADQVEARQSQNGNRAKGVHGDDKLGGLPAKAVQVTIGLGPGPNGIRRNQGPEEVVFDNPLRMKKVGERTPLPGDLE